MGAVPNRGRPMVGWAMLHDALRCRLRLGFQVMPPAGLAPAIDDVVSQFSRLQSMCDEGRERLHA